MAVVAILQQLALYQLYGAMMMMFVVKPSLESIEHKLNSKSIKFPKLQAEKTFFLSQLRSRSPRSSGSLGILGIENRKPEIVIFFSLSKPATTTKFLKFYLFIYLIN
jgi:hypothetical protein